MSTIKYLTPDELQRLVSATRRSAFRNRDRLCIALAARLGLRASEICNLRTSDVRLDELDHGTVAVASLKGGVDAILPFTREIRDLYDRWVDDPRRAESEFVCPTRTGGRLHRNQILRVVTAASRRAGIRHTWTHMLRHTAGMDLLDRPGATITDAQGLLRHRKVSTTAEYLKPRPHRLAALLEAPHG